jgi:DNA-binding CsgD family transcriptional regulator
MPDERLLELTENIYDAATGGAPWAVTGNGLVQLLGARSASLMVGDCMAGQMELLYHTDFALDDVVAYQKHYRLVDLWTIRAAQAVATDSPIGRPKVWISGHLVPDNEFLRSEFYVDFGRRLGLRYVLGTVLPLGASGAMPIGLHRPEGIGPFGETDQHLLECLLPHLRRALQLRHQLAAAPSSASPSLAALDAMSVGVLVVSADMRVLIANSSAEAMAANGSALRLVGVASSNAMSRTIAMAGHCADNLTLAALVRATALGGASGGAVRLRNDREAAALAALVAPLPRRLSGSPGRSEGRVGGQALILLRDLTIAPAPPPTELLRNLFGLTPAEAEIACALSGGITKEAVAAGRGLRVTTIRTQVRAVLEKTGAANLRDLERLLVHLPVP